jgi:hypothetical protein
MAGAILVAENIGISLNSSAFDHIIEKIRPNFGSGEDFFRDEIYSPVDDGGMSFISLREQNSDGFNAFVRAASIAYEREIGQQALSYYRHSWDELMTALRSDPRART